jgi:hypothetical protein
MENDKILAQKALEGNQDAFRQLVNLVEEKVFNPHCSNLLKKRKPRNNLVKV